MSGDIEANSSAIIICALKPLILLPSPIGIATVQLSPSLIVHLSTSLLGPSSLPLNILLNIGLFFQIVSIYSNIILLCLKAAPTTTILVPGVNTHFKIQYKLIKKDLPKPRLAINIGNGLIQNSCKMAACIGCNSMSNNILHTEAKYFVSLNTFMRCISGFSISNLDLLIMTFLSRFSSDRSPKPNQASSYNFKLFFSFNFIYPSH